MIETILCAVTWSPNGWTGPVERGSKDPMLGDWVRTHRWAGEDWLFARTPDQLVDGNLYTYAQGDPSDLRVEAAGGLFNVFFYVKGDTGAEVVGLYRHARYVSEGDHDLLWKKLKASGVARRRAAQVAAAFTDKKVGKREAAAYLDGEDLRWVVPLANVTVYETRPRLDAELWRAGNAHRVAPLTAHDQAQLARLLDDEEADPEVIDAGFPTPGSTPDAVIEGRKRQRAHLSRERSSSLARQFRASRLQPGPPPHFVCDACATTLVGEHGPFAVRGFDAHHQVPLAHASGRFTVDALRAFLKHPTS